MSSTQFQVIFDAAIDSYAKQTGVDLARHPSADKLQNCQSPEDVIQILLERATAFNDYRNKYRKLIDCLRPVVQVVHGVSGIIGEAASLVPFQPTSVIFVGIDILLSAAVGVSASYDALIDLIDCISNFLKRLHIYTEMTWLPSVMSDILVKIMAEVLAVFALATKQIKQRRFRKFAMKLLGECEVEAILQRLDRLTQEEARVTAAHSLEVVHGLFDNLRVAMDDGRTSSDGIRRALVEIQDLANEMNEMKRNELQVKVRNWLSPPDPSTNHNIARRDHLSGSSSWFIQGDAFKQWKDTSSLLWVHGKPGAGKSIICSSIIQDVENLRVIGLALVTYFYCDFRDPRKQDVSGILASLIAQLSAKSDACYTILSALYTEYDAGSRQPGDRVLIGCLQKMLNVEERPAIYIIIDAIDECPNATGVVPPRERVLELVENLVNSNTPDVHICVTSRPEADIQAALTSLASHSVSLHDEAGQKKDITDYIRSIVYSDRNMRRWRTEDKEMVIHVLSRKSEGMFRWIVCQLEALRQCFPSAIRRNLYDLPRGLDETYDRILLGIAQERQEFAQRLFQCLAVSIRPLRVEELADILAIQFNEGALPNYDANWRVENPEEAVLSACSSLISIVDVHGERVVRFSHFSVKEYLTSKRLADAGEHLSRYYILPRSAHTTLAQASLCILLALDDGVDKTSINICPLAIYAARYWVEHAQFDDISSSIEEALQCLFDSAKPHFSIWVWIYDIDNPFRGIMFTANPTLPNAVPLYYATLCGLYNLSEHLIRTCPQDINAWGGGYSTPLHAAVVKGNIDILTLLLGHGADVNTLNTVGQTPLHVASRRGAPNVVESLLNNHANVNAQDMVKRTPLYLASYMGDLEVTQVLLRHGASLDASDKDGGTPLMVAAKNGHLGVMRLLLQNGDATVDCYSNNGWTPLMIASHYGHPNAVRLLLESGAAVDFRGNHGWTPLAVVSRFGHADIARLLIKSGAAVDSRDDGDWTPLAIASQNGHPDIVRLLLENGAAVDSFNRVPSISAFPDGPSGVVSFLLQNDSSPVEQNSFTPLHLASATGYLAVAELLIHYKANVNIQNRNQETPLHRAAQGGHCAIVTLLFESGADVNVRDCNDKTALDLALDNGRFDVARFLVQYTSSLRHEEDTSIRSYESTISLHTASMHGDLKIVRSLLNRGVDVNERDEYYRTPVLYASNGGWAEVAELLIKYGADVNSRDHVGCTPLYFASSQGHLDVVHLLLDQGADANVYDQGHIAALHLASYHGHFEIVKALLNGGADIHARNYTGWTPAQVASWAGKRDVVRLLAEYDGHGI